MGVPLEKAAWMLGDNRSIIMSSTIPYSVLGKRHNALSYHHVRASIAVGYLKFCHIDGKQNPANILTKYLPYASFWPFVCPLLFWRGETKKPADS